MNCELYLYADESALPTTRKDVGEIESILERELSHVRLYVQTQRSLEEISNVTPHLRLENLNFMDIRSR